MKTRNNPRSHTAAFGAAVSLALLGLLAGCRQPLLENPEGRIPPGMGVLSVSLSDSPAAATSARTMLALDPEFSSYELQIAPDPDTVSGGTGTGSRTYSSNAGSFRILLLPATYTISAAGYTGDKRTAQTGDDTAPVSIDSGTQTDLPLTLRPYMDKDTPIYGTLHYSLNWDGVGQIPARAELLIEQYDEGGGVWNAIPISLIPQTLTAGSQRGTIVLIRRETGLVQQTGSLELPPGEYRLTPSVTMDGPNPPVSRTDIAHVFSNLTTPAAFAYSQGDLTVTSPGMDTGSGFIVSFNFAETPNAVSVVGSNAGPDGTLLIMVMVPTGTDLTCLTPVVECASGAHISSPPPRPDLVDGKPVWSPGDYSKPSSWTAEGRNGVTQQYTVVVTEQAADECYITGIAFDDVMLTAHPAIDHALGSILVEVPNGTRAANPNYELEPVISFVGKEIKRVDLDYLTDPSHDSPFIQGDPLVFMEDGAPSQTFRVYAQSGATKLYSVSILEAASGEAEITKFFFDGYPGRPGVITQPSGNPPGGGEIKVALPYGVPIGSFTPRITYKGNIAPASGVEQNFKTPLNYTVESADGQITKTYLVTVYTDGPSTDTGIFDMVIVNVPMAKVVVGTKARLDGKIPVVVQVPYATSPFITPEPSDGPRTDLKALIPRITLSSKTSKVSPDANGTTDIIPFGNQNDYQEAVYRVTAQAGNYQDYVVVVARDVQYYYVKATGDDTDPDQYNGGSESTPFRTLAYAVSRAVRHSVDHIYVIGTLNDTSENGAWEDTSATAIGALDETWHSSGAPQAAGGNSVFNIKGAGLDDGGAPRRIYITGIGSNAVLQGTADKRVISITGGAHITFDNITIRDGGGNSYKGNGGGIYIGEGSTVIWKSGSITGNKALSGGGVYVDSGEFDLMTGSVNANTAAGSASSGFTANNPVVQGGGGVYVNGDSLLWLANGEISDNNTAGAGGGVLINGSVVPNSPNDNDGDEKNDTPHNFIMSGGAVDGNTSTGSVWPQGGGGVFVAKGTFEMLSGHIMNNKSTRQGGGVFVWSRSLFFMDGDSSVTSNNGVGSSKAICNRGITTMRGNAQADKVYVWNYAKGSWNNGFGDEFTLMEGARVSGLVLSFADDPQDNRNYINIVDYAPPSGTFYTPGTDHITTIDLESRLNANGSFSVTATVDGDWKDHYLIKNGNGNTIPQSVLKRFPLNTFISGGAAQSLSGHKLGTTGKLEK